MSNFHVVACTLSDVRPHPNADTLSLGKADGAPVIFKTGEYREGDTVAYIPVDSVVPDTDQWSWLGGHRRIKAKRLRGIYSEGLITAAPAGAKPGDDLAEALGVTRYEPPVKGRQGPGASRGRAKVIAGPKQHVPVYGIEPARRIGIPDGHVTVTEKIHGCNARFVHDGKRLHIGSRTTWKHKPQPGLFRRLTDWLGLTRAERQPDDVWTLVAERYGLEEKLSQFPGVVIYGEVYGQVQDLTYGVPESERCRFVMFDMYVDGEMQDWQTVEVTATGILGLPIPPVLYSGPMHDGVYEMAEGKTRLSGDHVREGVVVRWPGGRAKIVGQGYRLRKEGDVKESDE